MNICCGIINNYYLKSGIACQERVGGRVATFRKGQYIADLGAMVLTGLGWYYLLVSVKMFLFVFIKSTLTCNILYLWPETRNYMAILAQSLLFTVIEVLYLLSGRKGQTEKYYWLKVKKNWPSSASQARPVQLDLAHSINILS